MNFIESAGDSLRQFWQNTVMGMGRDDGVVPAPVGAQQQFLASQSLASLLKYDVYDSETELFLNDGSISFCLEVLPQTGADENMATRLTAVLASLPPDTGVQWILFGDPKLDSHFDNYLQVRQMAIESGQGSQFFVDAAKRRMSYLRRSTGKNLFHNDNFSIRNIRLVLSVTRGSKGTSKSSSYADDNKRLFRNMAELKSSLKATLGTAHLPSRVMNAEDLINFLWPILNPDYMFKSEPMDRIVYDDGKSIRDQLVRPGQRVRANIKGLLFGEEDENDPYSLIEMKPLTVLSYPKEKRLWEMTNLIGSYYDDGLQYACPYVITGGIWTLDQNVVDNKAMFNAARAKQNAKSKMAEYQPELAMQNEDWQIVVHQLNNGGTMCELYHTLLLFAPPADISRCTTVAKNIWKNEKFVLCDADCFALPSLLVSLPMTLTNEVRNDLKTYRLISTKTTVNATDMSPVLAEWKGAGDPVMMFFGRRGQATFLDFYSNKQGNYNVFIAGVSGSGKSVTMNEIIASYRATGARVWVIDVGRSYRNQIALQKGTFIEFTPRSDMCINPFSWVGADEENTFLEELKLLRPMIGRMASPDHALTAYQNALITEAITGVWNDYGQDTDPTKIAEYLMGNIRNEHGAIERQAFELGRQLQPFTKDGMYGRYFNGRANISLDGDMIGLELEELKDVEDLRRVVLFVLTSRIANDMYLSRDRRKLCLVDEAWQLLGDDPETAAFIAEGYRRARKYKGIFAVGTQGIDDAFANPAAFAAYTNADWKIYLRQDPEVLESMISQGKASFNPAVKRMLTSLQTQAGKYSELLISSPNGSQVVRHAPDPFSLMMASSSADDFVEISQLLEQGHDTMQAINIMLKKRGINA
jgi:conjugal transfer ATP-binding protein TraC